MSILVRVSQNYGININLRIMRILKKNRNSEGIIRRSSWRRGTEEKKIFFMKKVLKEKEADIERKKDGGAQAPTVGIGDKEGGKKKKNQEKNLKNIIKVLKDLISTKLFYRSFFINIFKSQWVRKTRSKRR